MHGRRNNPVTYVCTVCGAECETWCCRIPLYCPACLEKRRKASAQKYDTKHREERNARQRILRKRNPDYARRNHERYLKLRDDPIFREKQREYQRRYYQDHKERLQVKARIYHASHREERLHRMREYDYEHAERISTLRLLRRKAKKNSSAAMTHIAMTGKLRECPRMKIRAMSLPCGLREECFGSPPCPNCPKGAIQPKRQYFVGNGGD